MLFNSYIFILLFLPMALVGYFWCNSRGRYEWGKCWLTAMSLWFYAYFNIKYLPIIVVSILANYCLYRFLLGCRGSLAARRKQLYITVAGVFANLGVLFYYKYFDFFLENINAVFRTDFVLQKLVLPLGISFFTFQQIGFLIDAYRGEADNYSFLDYGLFVTFFPQLIAGPIVTHDEMIGQFADLSKKKWDSDNFAKGLYSFVCGLAKKVLVADIFGKAVNWGYGNVASLNGAAAVLLIMSYSIQLYFDFSGYSDMARGIGYMFNIEIPANFLSPYKATNLLDFWKRWHITLNRFFTKYVYIPLGGNRKGRVRTCINIFMIYLVSGIWHGAGWLFLLWGTLHGVTYVLTKELMPQIKKIPRVMTWVVTQMLVQIYWVFFRAESLQQALGVLGRATGGSWSLLQMPVAFAEQFRTPEFFYCMKVLGLDTISVGGANICNLILMLGYLLAAWGMILLCRNIPEAITDFKPTAAKSVFVTVLLLWSLVSFSQVSTFLYFNF